MEMKEQKQVKKKGRKLWALILTAILVLSLVPAASVFADGEGYIDLELDTPYTITWNNGTWFNFQFTAPATGYYAVATEGEVAASVLETYVQYKDGPVWFSPATHVTGPLTVFMIEGYTYYLEAGTVEPYWDSDAERYTSYIWDGDEKEQVAYDMTLSYAGFNDFISGCPAWDIGTMPEGTIDFPAAVSGRYFSPVQLTVPADGYYWLEVESNVQYCWPILLNADGSILTEPNTQADSVASTGAYFTTGDTYYLLPTSRVEVGDHTLTVRAGENDLSYYCYNGRPHEYEDQVVKATFGAAGSFKQVCPVCGHTGEESVIMAASASLENTKYTYTGAAIEPTVNVATNGRVLQEGCDYTVAYENNVEPGTATATVTLTDVDDWYEGSTTLEFSIVSDGTADERTDITSVQISGIVTPVAGESPGDWEETVAVPGTAEYSHYYVSELKWMDKENYENLYYSIAYDDEHVLTAADTFEEGKTYVLMLRVETADDAYRFYNELAEVELNDVAGDDLAGLELANGDTYSDDTGDVKELLIACEYTCAAASSTGEDPGEESGETPITSVELNVAAPAAGTDRKTWETGSNQSTDLTVPAGSHYSVEWAGWYGPGPDFADGVGNFTFEAGGTYRVSVTLKADDGYDFAADLTAAIGGDGSLVEITDIYNQAPAGYSGVNLTVEVQIPVTKAAQTITASDITKTFGDAAFSLGAKTSGDGTLTYKSSNTAVAVVSDAGKVTIKGAGTAAITITAAETDSYKAASKKITVKVNQAAQTITAANKTKTFGNAAFSLGAKTSGDGKLTYSSSSTKVAAVSSAGQIMIKGAGTAKITVSAAATTNYKAASKTITLTVNKAANPMKASGKTKKLTYEKVSKKAQTIKAKNAFTVSKNKGKVTYAKSSGNSKITVSSAGKVTVKKGLKKGTYNVKVKVTAAGNANYKKLTKKVTLKIKIA